MPEDPRTPSAEEPVEELETEPEEVHAQSRLGHMLLDALETMDEDPDAVEEMHRRFFGEDVVATFEQATLAHIREGSGEADEGAGSAPTRLESFVHLSFKQARAESSVEDDAELAKLEAELGAQLKDPDETEGAEDE